MDLQNPRLRQRGRASLDFLALLGKQSGLVREQVARDLDAAGVTAKTLPADVEEWRKARGAHGVCLCLSLSLGLCLSVSLSMCVRACVHR